MHRCNIGIFRIQEDGRVARNKASLQGAYGVTKVYAYVAGNPLSKTDPNGEFGVDTLVLAGIGGLSNGLVNGLNYSSQNCSFWKEFENGFIGGAIGDAVFSANPFAGGAVGGAVTAALNRRQNVQVLDNPIADIGSAAGLGGAAGWAGGAAGEAAAAQNGNCRVKTVGSGL